VIVNDVALGFIFGIAVRESIPPLRDGRPDARLNEQIPLYRYTPGKNSTGIRYGPFRRENGEIAASPS
jgi:hypothetical protein